MDDDTTQAALAYQLEIEHRQWLEEHDPAWPEWLDSIEKQLEKQHEHNRT